MCLLAFVGFECVLLILYDVARRGEFLRDSRVANVYYDLANAGDRRYCFNNGGLLTPASILICDFPEIFLSIPRY